MLELKDGEDTQFELSDRFTKKKVLLDWTTFCELMELVVANWVEQYRNPLKNKKKKKEAKGEGETEEEEEGDDDKKEEAGVARLMAEFQGLRNRYVNATKLWSYCELYLTPPAQKALTRMFKDQKKELKQLEATIEQKQKQMLCTVL